MGMAPVFQADTPSAAYGRLEGHRLTGESEESNVYLGFWRENPQVFAAQFDAQDSVLAGLQRQQGGAGGPSAADVAQLARFRPPEKCWFGMTCRNKNTCSRSHGDQPEHLRKRGDNVVVPVGHPLRANRGAPGPSGKFQGGTITGKRPGEHYVCRRRPAQRPLPQRVPRGDVPKCGRQGAHRLQLPEHAGPVQRPLRARPPPRDGGGGGRWAAAAWAAAWVAAAWAAGMGRRCSRRPGADEVVQAAQAPMDPAAAAAAARWPLEVSQRVGGFPGGGRRLRRPAACE